MQQAAAPWQSVQANRFSSSIASFYRNISAHPPSGCMKPIKWKVCGKDWSKRREAALSSTLGLLWPPRCLASRGKSAPHAARAIYLDLGSRNPEPEARNISGTRSSLEVFATRYPDAWAFHVVAFEADPVWAPLYRSRKAIQRRYNFSSLDFHNVLVGVADSTSSFSTNSGADAGIVRKRERSRTVTREVPSLDFALWLSTHVKPQDFVVVKMDIESMEFELLPHLIRRGVAPLIDELFVECHCVESFNHRCGRKYAECIDLHRRSYEAGIWVHDWD